MKNMANNTMDTFYNLSTDLYTIHVKELVDNTRCLLEKQIQ